jgi:hypothetical protein
MQTLSATAAQQAGARAAECRQRVNQLANHCSVSAADVQRARAALREAITRAANAQDRCERRRSGRASTRRSAEDASILSPELQGLDLAALRRQARCLDGGDLFLHYFSLGGCCTDFELDAFVHAALELPSSEITVLAHAIWELTEF